MQSGSTSTKSTDINSNKLPGELQALAHSAEESQCPFSKAYQYHLSAQALHHTAHIRSHLCKQTSHDYIH